MKLNFYSLLAVLAQRSFSGGLQAANTAQSGDIFAAMNLPLEPSPDLAGGSGGVFAANAERIELARERSLEAANDANLTGFHLSEPLTEFATGAPDANGLQEFLNMIAPPVPTGMRFSYQVHTEAEERVADSIAAIRRPIGGEFPNVRLTGSETNGNLFNLGLTTFIDHDQGGLNPLVQQHHVLNLLNRILRAQVVNAMGLIDAAATDAGSTNWGSSTSNPDKDLRTDLRTAKLARGERSNMVLIGDAAWQYRQDAYEQPARTNSGTKAGYTPQQLATALRVGNVVIGEETKRSSATALADIVGSATYNFMVNPVATTSDMSNVKQFTMMGAGGAVEVFIEQLTKRVKVTVSKYANTVITSSVGIRKRTITYTES